MTPRCSRCGRYISKKEQIESGFCRWCREELEAIKERDKHIIFRVEARKKGVKYLVDKPWVTLIDRLNEPTPSKHPPRENAEWIIPPKEENNLSKPASLREIRKGSIDRKPALKVTPEDIAEWKRLFNEEKKSVHEIARIVGRSNSTVIEKLRAEGLDTSVKIRNKQGRQEI